MATGQAVLLVFISIFLCFEAQSGFLDFEELSSINYGIDIIDKPVVLGQEPPGAIVLRSKYGQQYQCSYTDPAAEGERERQEQQEARETGIPELLRPLAESGCLKYPKDWWTYELCYGRDVKQYHVEEGNSITGKIIYLGYFESEFDWDNITEKDKARKYHSQLYTNGTTCDLTNKPRQVEVRFECQDVDTDTIFEISEAQTCVYTLVVHTARLCKHPALKRASPAKPVPITCNPLISRAQYEEYMNTKQAQAEVLDPSPADPTAAARRLIEEILGKDAPTGTDTNNKLKVKIFTADELREILKSTATGSTPEGHGQAVDQQGQGQGAGKSEPNSQTVVAEANSETDHEATVKGTTSDDEVKDTEESLEESDIDGTVTSESFTEEDDVDDDEKIMAAFDKELTDIVDTAEKKAQVEMHSENIESTMQAKFSDIIDEAEEELAQEGNTVKVDRHQAFSDLAKTLTKLLSRLHRSEREKRAVKKHLMEAQLLAAVNRARSIANTFLKKDDTKKQAIKKHLMEAQLLAAVNQARSIANTLLKKDDKSDVPNEKLKADKGVNLLDKEKDQTHLVKEETQENEAPQQIKDQILQHAEQNQQIEDPDQHAEHNQQITDQTQPAEPTSEHDEAQEDHSKSDTDDTDPDGNSLTQLHSLNNRVRVRVTRIKHAPPASGAEAVEDGKAALEPDGHQQTLQIPDDQRKELESTVKSELEKAGLETTGQKIEVKIITAGYFDTNKEGVHVLSEEESSVFNNMIVSILGGNSQAAKEMTHQQQMEDSYSHVWGTESKKQKKSTMSPPAHPPVPPS